MIVYLEKGWQRNQILPTTKFENFIGILLLLLIKCVTMDIKMYNFKTAVLLKLFLTLMFFPLQNVFMKCPTSLNIASYIFIFQITILQFQSILVFSPN